MVASETCGFGVCGYLISRHPHAKGLGCAGMFVSSVLSPGEVRVSIVQLSRKLSILLPEGVMVSDK